LKLRKVHIRNFRNLKNVNVIFWGPGVIVGENDSGKSNLKLVSMLLISARNFSINLRKHKFHLNKNNTNKHFPYVGIVVLREIVG